MAARVALITGAGSGMGRLAAQRLGRGGCRVAALDVNEVGLAETAHASANIQRFVVDVTDTKEVEQGTKTEALRAESRAAQAIEALAARIEGIAAKLEAA